MHRRDAQASRPAEIVMTRLPMDTALGDPGEATVMRKRWEWNQIVKLSFPFSWLRSLS